MNIEKKKREIVKLKEEAKALGINPSDDAIYIVTELRGEVRSIILPLLGTILATIIGFGIAILTLFS